MNNGVPSNLPDSHTPVSVSLMCMFEMCMCLNHTVRANVPEILNEESCSDVDEGICHQCASTVVLCSWFSSNMMHSSRMHLCLCHTNMKLCCSFSLYSLCDKLTKQPGHADSRLTQNSAVMYFKYCADWGPDRLNSVGKVLVVFTVFVCSPSPALLVSVLASFSVRTDGPLVPNWHCWCYFHCDLKHICYF